MLIELKTELLKRRLTQVELASRLGIADSMLSIYMRGHKPMPDSMKGRVAQILNVRKTSLFPEG